MLRLRIVANAGNDVELTVLHRLGNPPCLRRAGGLSAVLANDVVCLAMAPVLIDVCSERGLWCCSSACSSSIVQSHSAAHDAVDGAVLALSSTLAGNFVIVGSIANIIVLDQAARLGIAIDWRTHARVGIPVTLITLAIAAAWLVRY